MAASPEDLQRRYEEIHESRMRGLPILNPALRVAALEFRRFGEDRVGVLVTPWFINLVVLPGDGSRYPVQGERLDYALPGEALEMTVHSDAALGSYLSAVLYRDVAAIPDMACGRKLASDIIARLFARPAADERSLPSTISRRALFTAADDT